MKKGTPTHTRDINGDIICLGDICRYDDESEAEFVVIFEDNAFRKRFLNWDNDSAWPILDVGYSASMLRIKITAKWHSIAQDIQNKTKK